MRTVPKVSICIATLNMKHLIMDTIDSVRRQDYPNIEICVYDDGSTDGTEELFSCCPSNIIYKKGVGNSGTGEAFNKSISMASGDYIVTLCADDIITDCKVVSDIADMFYNKKYVGVIVHYYYQFVNGYAGAVRAWRGNDAIALANNPSGIAFRKNALKDTNGFSNKMFIEVASIVSEVISNGWSYEIMKWDTIAVRVHSSISTNPNYYLKRWTSSPVEEWARIGGHDMKGDFTSLIQIKNYFRTDAVIKEAFNFIRLRPSNILHPAWWFFSIVAIFTPRIILRKVPLFYRHRIGRHFTKEIKRP
jgi:glycosyltransferase involved in cell wall biosynthesis